MVSYIVNLCLKHALNSKEKSFKISDIYEENAAEIEYNEVLNVLKRIDKIFVVSGTQIEINIKVNIFQ